jgi:hypothetical protein
MVPEDYREVCPSFKRVKNPPAKPKEEPITITVESSLEYEDREEDYWVWFNPAWTDVKNYIIEASMG